MVGMRLNNPLFIGGIKGPKGEEVDQYGDYHLKSSDNRGGWDGRHNRIRDELVAMAESAGIRVESEPIGLFGGNDSRRPDFIFRECPLFENRDVIFDVSVTHPVRGGPIVGNACVPGEAASIGEKDKTDH
jgi:hypothetical protein